VNLFNCLRFSRPLLDPGFCLACLLLRRDLAPLRSAFPWCGFHIRFFECRLHSSSFLEGTCKAPSFSLHPTGARALRLWDRPLMIVVSSWNPPTAMPFCFPKMLLPMACLGFSGGLFAFGVRSLYGCGCVRSTPRSPAPLLAPWRLPVYNGACDFSPR